ncbi:MAG: GNAT family N-acetyltransferase [Halobacteriales archaeon]
MNPDGRDDVTHDPGETADGHRLRHVDTAGAALRRDVGRLLEAVDTEFHPPLSQRSLPEPYSDDLDGYVERTLDAELVVVETRERLDGLMSFERGRTDDAWDESRATYVVTLAVDPARRRRGVARALYDEVARLSTDGLLATRTWESNEGHRRLLEKLGFDVVRRVEDDRPGGVDSLVYARERPEVDGRPRW